MRTENYLAGSLVAALVVIWHAFATREQFFPSMVYLYNSRLSIAVLGNLGFALALTSYKLLTWAFLGRLRDSEIERINDKVSQAVIETLLAMTIFRQDFTIGFFAAFVVLSFVKIFHWMVQDRVDFIETTPNVSRSQHIRIVAFILLLVGIDYILLHNALSTTLTKGVSIHLLFAFEYAIQISTAVTILAKYTLSVIDMALEGRWEGKGVAVFYIELALDLLHLITYSVFFAAVFTTYGIPIHLVRDLYWTFRNFQTRVRDFLRYRRVAANMERRFPDATAEDLERADHVCIVCREEMGPGSRAKKLDCGHTFHLHCLRSWLERQQNCPICRAPVLATEPRREERHRHGDGEQDRARREAGAGDAGRGQEDGERDDAQLAAALRLEVLRNLVEQGREARRAQNRAEGRVGAAAPAAEEGLRRRRAGPQDGGAGGAAAAARGGTANTPEDVDDAVLADALERLYASAGLAGDTAGYMPPGYVPYDPYNPYYAAAPGYLPQQQWMPAPSLAMLVPNADGTGGFQQVIFAGQLGPEAAAAAAGSAGDGASTSAAQQAQQGIPQSVVPMIPVPVLIPLITPPAPVAQPQQQQNQSESSASAGALQPTPEQHAIASAIAAAATAAAMVGMPMVAAPHIASTTTAPRPEEQGPSSGSGTGESAQLQANASTAAVEQSEPSASSVPGAVDGNNARNDTAASEQQPPQAEAVNNEAEEIRRRRLERFQASANL